MTFVPRSYGWLQSAPQLMPGGLVETIPVSCPEPDFVTVKMGLVVKVAVTDLERSIVRVHVRPLPVQAPLHPANAAVPSGWAVSVTPVTDAYVSVQSVPQSIPAGLLVTFVDDAVHAFSLAAEHGSGRVLNVGTGVETSVNGLYRMLAEITGFQGAPAQGPARPGDLRRSVLDVSAASETLNWRPWTHLEDGLSETVAYLRGI